MYTPMADSRVMYNDMAMTDVCKQIHENMFKKTNMNENAKNKYT